ncbi:MAG: hypothetical protein AB1641_03460 [Thermodesulfobacteriota bacterium]
MPEELQPDGEAKPTTDQAGPGAGSISADEPSGGPEKEQPRVPEIETIPDNFQPFYHREARLGTLKKAALYLLLAALVSGLVGLVVDAYLRNAPFRLEATAIGVITLALIGLLWKMVSLESKAGLAAVGVSFILVLAQTLYDRELGLPGLPAGLIPPVYLCLVLAVGLFSVWFVFPRPVWLALLLSLVFIYPALAPAWLIYRGGASAPTVWLGPAFMDDWPVFLRPGWLLAQATLPLGSLLLLAAQAKSLMKPPFEKHWGFVFWCVSLVLASFMGLAGLERAGQPVFPNVSPVVSRLNPTMAPLAADSGGVAAKSGAAGSQSKPETSAVPETVKSQPESSRIKPEAGADPTEIKPGRNDQKAEDAAVDEDREGIAELTQRILALEQSVQEMKTRMEAQERLIRALLDYFGARPEGSSRSDSGSGFPPDAEPEEEQEEEVTPPRVEHGLT